jgi:hypothetical protein
VLLPSELSAHAVVAVRNAGIAVGKGYQESAANLTPAKYLPGFGAFWNIEHPQKSPLQQQTRGRQRQQQSDSGSRKRVRRYSPLFFHLSVAAEGRLERFFRQFN